MTAFQIFGSVREAWHRNDKSKYAIAPTNNGLYVYDIENRALYFVPSTNSARGVQGNSIAFQTSKRKIIVVPFNGWYTSRREDAPVT